MVPAPLSVFSITAALAAPAWAALTADLSSSESIKAAARLAVEDLLTFYHGNEPGQIPGILPGPPPAGPYYWWQGGAMWGTLIDYWHYTNDTSFNDLIMQAMLFQTGDDNNYMPLNWTASLGNDDQAFWGMSALLAAETNFQNPPANDKRQWLALAQAVFNTQASPDRHDNTCGGGLRWQIPMSNKGYDYKNSIANGCFFNMGARLARYTNNDSYAEWSRNTWDWMVNVGFLDNDYNIYDGAYVWNCTDIKKAQFGYNAAVFLQGAAYMYNYTTGSEQEMWKERTNGLLNATLRVFFPDNIAYEVACEGISTCNTDMRTYKGYLHRWMAVTAQIAPFTRDTILGVLKPSTEAALKTCTGGSNGRMCGFNWKDGAFSGSPGAGEQMDIISALTSYLVALEEVGAPLTNTTGGTSQGNPAAGTSSSGEWWRNINTPAPTKDKVGAGFLTIMLLVSAIAMFVWMSMDEKTEDDMFMGHQEKGKGKSVLDILKL